MLNMAEDEGRNERRDRWMQGTKDGKTKKAKNQGDGTKEGEGRNE